jgi:hypothetical protein
MGKMICGLPPLLPDFPSRSFSNDLFGRKHAKIEGNSVQEWTRNTNGLKLPVWVSQVRRLGSSGYFGCGGARITDYEKLTRFADFKS